MNRMTDKLRLLSVSESPPPPEYAPPSAAPPWIELPLDVTADIMRRLDACFRDTGVCAQLVCTTWWRVCQDPATWRVIQIVNDDYRMPEEYCSIMCRRAVDRSQGQLVDLTVAYFGDYKLLLYIANRSSHLKRLRLAFHHYMKLSPISVTEAVKKLPELEELHLNLSMFYCDDDSVDLEPLTIACSTLTSFSLNKLGTRDFGWFLGRFHVWKSSLSNESVAAIAKNMPSLCHLELLGNELDNEGLEALLDGCPRLESLDLRGCSAVDLGGELGERCRFQIKNLRLPSDSVDDCKWQKPIDLLHVFLEDDRRLSRSRALIDVIDFEFDSVEDCYDWEP